jgi:hypothetical protein
MIKYSYLMYVMYYRTAPGRIYLTKQIMAQLISYNNKYML